MQLLIGAQLSAMSAPQHFDRNAASISRQQLRPHNGGNGSARWFGKRTLHVLLMLLERMVLQIVWHQVSTPVVPFVQRVAPILNAR
jgi:hypothetical protein